MPMGALSSTDKTDFKGKARTATKAQQPGGKAPTMKSRVFTFTSLIVLLAALSAAPAIAQTSPAQDVYNPNGEVLDVVEGGGETLPDEQSGGCDDADGLDPEGNAVETGSGADCSDAQETEDVCNEADGLDTAGNSVTFGSEADCAVAEVCAEADGLDGDGNSVAYGSSEDCSNSTTPVVTEGELPFTGFEAGMVALAGMALLGGGFAMRRVARRDSL